MQMWVAEALGLWVIISLMAAPFIGLFLAGNLQAEEFTKFSLNNPRLFLVPTGVSTESDIDDEEWRTKELRGSLTAKL